MCAIFGIYDIRSRGNIDGQIFTSALNTMVHRGPDHGQVKLVNNQVTLGHRRLAIVDLDARANQPFSIADRYHIVFNGEIYNFRELRQRLASFGHTFGTDSDTEVLLLAYIQWGENCVNLFNGMWAFAIYDSWKGTLFCSRDRFGEKPFYYAQINDKIIFSSEIKAITSYFPQLSVANHNAISNFCRTSVGAQHQETWFSEIHRLPPSHNLTINAGVLRFSKYWNYDDSAPEDFDTKELIERFKHLFIDSVKIRSNTEVNTGITLSSGLDSSSIAYAISKDTPRIFTAYTSVTRDPQSGVWPDSFVDKSDEASAAELTATQFGLLHRRVPTSYDDFPSRMSNVIYHLESGHASPAVFPLMQLMQMARGEVKVLLEGQGADELLAGYIENSFPAHLIDLIRAGSACASVRETREYLAHFNAADTIFRAIRDAANDYPILHRLNPATKHNIYGPALEKFVRLSDHTHAFPGAKSTLNRSLMRQHSGGLVNLLHYGDAISMANGIEARLPFLDHRLVEFGFSLPATLKTRGSIGKVIQREAMRGLVRAEILDNRQKIGFHTPISGWLRTKVGRSYAFDNLLSSKSLRRGLFQPKPLEKFLQVHCKGEGDYGSHIFRLLSTELWFQVFIDQKAN